MIIERHQSIGSTNDRAKELAASGVRDVCVVADSQTCGRGRMGRSFFSPPGTGLYVSFVLPPEDLSMLTVSAAVFTARAVEKTIGTQVGIKWVNDLLLCGKKICGILAEGVFCPGEGIPYAVVGIGINVLKADFPESIRETAGDIESLSGIKPDKEELLSRLIAEFENGAHASRRDILGEYRSRSVVLGKEIRVFRGTESYAATALSVDDNGGLWVSREGERILLQSGEVSIRIPQE